VLVVHCELVMFGVPSRIAIMVIGMRDGLSWGCIRCDM